MKMEENYAEKVYRLRSQSNWKRRVRIMAYVLRFIRKCTPRFKPKLHYQTLRIKSTMKVPEKLTRIELIASESCLIALN